MQESIATDATTQEPKPSDKDAQGDSECNMRETLEEPVNPVRRVRYFVI